MCTLSYQTTRDTTIRTCLEKPPYNKNHLYAILHMTQLYLPAYSNHLTIITSCLPYCQTQIYLPAYSNHLTITTTCLPYYQKHNCTICLQQPPYNNIHMSAILPETQIYLPAYNNHLTITTTCLPYYQRHNYTYLPIETTLQ